MQLTEDTGLKLNKQEIEALLSFAAKSPKSSFYGVHFKVTPAEKEGGKSIIRARATDGQIAVDAYGFSSNDAPNEWFVNRAFLAGALVHADNAHHITFKFNGASLHEAAIADEAGNEVAMYVVTGAGAALAQQSFPEQEDWDDLLLVPTHTKAIKSLSIPVSGIKNIEKLGRAAGTAAVEQFIPNRTETRTIFRAEGDDTTWIAIAEPRPQLGPEGDEGEDPIPY